MYNSLEDIKAECDRLYPEKPPLMVNENHIAETLQPYSRTYVLKLDLLLPTMDANLKNGLIQLRDKIRQCGFEAKTQFGLVTNRGTQHLELVVKDKPQPLYHTDEEVGFRADPSGPPKRFRVNSSLWDTSSKVFIYDITSTANTSVGFRSVPEHSLSKISSNQ